MASHSAQEKEIEAIQPSAAAYSETSSQYDDAYEAYKQNQGAVTDAAEKKRVLRKIDFRIVPILFFIYLLQYLDKNGINYASAYGLTEGTRLKGQDFSWLGMVYLLRLWKISLTSAQGPFSTLVILLANTPQAIFCNACL